ncbi:MAG: helix-turn-helix transcriptional regulator [Verrucomicrobiota bacterium JB025]|nr:WYL domain-containing protein [Verrucomicrobiota bacterium JB025]
MQRIYAIHSSIRSGAYPNCTTLARKLEVDRKTIHRDLTFMRDGLGLPLVYCEDLHGYRYDEDVSDFPVFEISEEELATLFFARTALQGMRGTRVAEVLGNAFSKVAGSLLGRVQLTWSDLDTAFSRKVIKQDKRLLKPFGQLAKAVIDQVEVSFHYRKLGNAPAEARRVQPLHLGEVDGGWYLIAHDLDRGALRTFALPRMTRVRVLKTGFARPEDFDGEAYLNASFGIWNVAGDDARHVVKLELRNYAARLAQERRWHPSQEVTAVDGEDERVLVSFEVGRLEEVMRWVLSFGSQAKVLEPLELVEMVRNELREMQRN